MEFSESRGILKKSVPVIFWTSDTNPSMRRIWREPERYSIGGECFDKCFDKLKLLDKRFFSKTGNSNKRQRKTSNDAIIYSKLYLNKF